MQPFSALPPKVLWSMVAVASVLAAAAILAPLTFLVLLSAGLVLTALGGSWIALEGRARRRGEPFPRPLSSPTFLASAVGIAVFGVLVAYAAPGLTGRDAGELVSAAHVLGVAHPTGFPLFCMAGKAFDLLPAGDVFYRMNLSSAASMAIACAFAFLLAREVGLASGTFPVDQTTGRRSPLAAIAAPIGLLAAPTVWQHSLTTEVYAISLAGLSATLVAFAAAARTRDRRYLVLGWMLAGLGLGGHVTWPLYAAFAGIAATTVVLPSGAPSRPGTLAACLVAALAASLVVLYLPAAALRDPIRNWGDPSTPGRLLDHLSARRIRDSFAGEMGPVSWLVFRVRFARALGVLWDGSAALWPFAIAALVRARRFPFARSLGWLILLDLLYATLVNPMGVRDLQTLQPATLGIAALGAAGMAWLVRESAGGPWRVSSIGVCLLALAIPVATAPVERDLSRTTAARDVATGLLAALPPRASVLTTSDDLSSGLAALQSVEGARPDVLALVKQHLDDRAYVERELAAHRIPGVDDGLERRIRPDGGARQALDEDLGRIVSILSDRGPVFVEPGEDRVDRGLIAAMVPGFPVFSAAGRDMRALEKAAVAAWDQALSHAPAADRWSREYLGGGLRLIATYLALQGGDALAVEMLTSARTLAPDDPRTAHNLGVLSFDSGRRERGVELVEESIRLDPLYGKGWRTLARMALATGRDARAREAAERALELMGGDARPDRGEP